MKHNQTLDDLQDDLKALSTEEILHNYMTDENPVSTVIERKLQEIRSMFSNVPSGRDYSAQQRSASAAGHTSR